MSSSNPYDSPAPVVNPAKTYTKGSQRLDFGEMFRFLFSNPNWAMTLLWGSLCVLLGGLIVPQIIFSGYLWEIVERLHRRQTNSYADFDTNRLGDYLMRGVWPFLVQMLLSIILVVLIIPLMMCGVIGMGIAGANDAPLLGGMAIVGMYGMMFVLMMIFQLAIMPIVLRGGLSQDLGTAFNFGWAKDFFVVMWKEMFVGSLVLAGAGLVCYFVGLMLFCVGIYPAMVIWMFSSTHFMWQLYEIFLQRGGTPIPLKAPPGAPMMPQ